jgi:hypothetical protein
MIAALELARVKLGAPVILHYHVTNLSSQALPMVLDVDAVYWVMVTDASGTELPLTKEGTRLREPPLAGIGGMSPLAPGADDGDHSLDLTKRYQLDRPGSYLVRIAMRMGVPPDVPYPKTMQERAKVPIEEAVSDLIPFTIVP